MQASAGAMAASSRFARSIGISIFMGLSRLRATMPRGTKILSHCSRTPSPLSPRVPLFLSYALSSLLLPHPPAVFRVDVKRSSSGTFFESHPPRNSRRTNRKIRAEERIFTDKRLLDIFFSPTLDRLLSSLPPTRLRLLSMRRASAPRSANFSTMGRFARGCVSSTCRKVLRSVCGLALARSK